MEPTELVLKTMREAGMPLNAGKIAELSGIERKVVDKAMTAMESLEQMGDTAPEIPGLLILSQNRQPPII